MSPEQEELWQRMKAYALDDPGSSMTFTDRLCRENDWSISYGVRAVLEYKRFMFLACASGHPCTPSDEVDQVWHLHLLYTQSYWKEWCAKVMGKEIHHGPTKGGGEEREKYEDWYQRTKQSYLTFFGKEPPADLWPDPESRMRFIHFTRVNRHKQWVLPKPKWLWK